MTDGPPWELVVTTRAEREMRRLPTQEQARIQQAMDALHNGPNHGDIRKLEDRPGEWRLRVGDYRVIFGRDSANRVILVLRVLHRRDAYRDA